MDVVFAVFAVLAVPWMDPRGTRLGRRCRPFSRDCIIKKCSSERVHTLQKRLFLSCLARLRSIRLSFLLSFFLSYSSSSSSSFFSSLLALFSFSAPPLMLLLLLLLLLFLLLALARTTTHGSYKHKHARTHGFSVLRSRLLEQRERYAPVHKALQPGHIPATGNSNSEAPSLPCL